MLLAGASILALCFASGEWEKQFPLTVLALCIPKIGFCILGMNYLGDRWKEQLPAVFLISASIFYIDSDFPPLHLLACSYSILE